MMESEREKHIKWSWHLYHMVCIACPGWVYDCQFSQRSFHPLLLEPTSGKQKTPRGREVPRNLQQEQLRKAFLKDETFTWLILKRRHSLSSHVPYSWRMRWPLKYLWQHTAISDMLQIWLWFYWAKYLSEVSHWEMEEPNENAAVTPSSPLPRKASRRST